MRKHALLYRIFKLPRVLNPIFYIGGLNKLYIIFLFFIKVWSIFTKNNKFQINFYAETIQLKCEEFRKWPPFYLDQDG